MARSKVTGAEHNVHKRNFFYYMIYPYVKAVFFRFYGKLEVRGLENIPRNEPVIFAPNHQNALMDALIVLFSAPQDIVFLARADIFSKKIMAFFLNSMKMLPVFRQRDGASELGKNVDIFDISVSVLHNRHYLCVMPEGNHGEGRKLRTIVKGIFRIAFKAQEKYADKPFVKILPVGIDVGHYVKQNQKLLIQYGKPIEVSEYWDQYNESNARGINAMKSRLGEEIKPLMIHIESEEFYDTLMGVKPIFNPQMREILGIEGSKHSDRFVADKEIIARLEAAASTDAEQVRPLAEAVKQYMAGVEKLNVRDWVVRDKGYGFLRTLWRYLTLIVTLPVFLFGFITNIIPYHLPVRMVRNIKDLQFHSSVKAGLGFLLVFPVTYLVLTVLVAIFTHHWWIPVIFLVSLLPMGMLALTWYLRLKKTQRGGWFARQLRSSNPSALDLVKQREEVIKLTNDLVNPSS